MTPAAAAAAASSTPAEFTDDPGAQQPSSSAAAAAAVSSTPSTSEESPSPGAPAIPVTTAAAAAAAAALASTPAESSTEDPGNDQPSTSAASAPAIPAAAVGATAAPAAQPDMEAITGKCRACDHSHPAHKTYPDKREAENKGRPKFVMSLHCEECLSGFHRSCTVVNEKQLYLYDKKRRNPKPFFCASCRPEQTKKQQKKQRKKQSKKLSQRGVGTDQWMQIDHTSMDEKIGLNPLPEVLFRGGKPYAPSGFGILEVENGEALHKLFDINSPDPIVYLIKDMAGLDLNMLDPGKDIDAIIDVLLNDMTPDEMVRVTDSDIQQPTFMSLREFRERVKNRKGTFNVLNIEIGQKLLGSMISSPKLYKEMSLEERFWPEKKLVDEEQEEKEREKKPKSSKGGAKHTGPRLRIRYAKDRPRVEMYCIFGMAGSFTGMHLDFGGSSVWFHVYSGVKVFYISPPRREYLDKYQQFEIDDEKNLFLGDQFGQDCWRVEVSAGQTLILPSGTLHAVWTKEDSIAFTGSFLSDNFVPMQLAINAMEIRQALPKMKTKGTTFQFPNFELVHLRLAQAMTLQLREDSDAVPDHRIQGALALVEHIGDWLRDKAITKSTKLPAVNLQTMEVGEETVDDVLANLKAAVEPVAEAREIQPVDEVMDTTIRLVRKRKNNKAPAPKTKAKKSRVADSRDSTTGSEVQTKNTASTTTHSRSKKLKLDSATDSMDHSGVNGEDEFRIEDLMGGVEEESREDANEEPQQDGRSIIEILTTVYHEAEVESNKWKEEVRRLLSGASTVAEHENLDTALETMKEKIKLFEEVRADLSELTKIADKYGECRRVMDKLTKVTAELEICKKEVGHLTTGDSTTLHHATLLAAADELQEKLKLHKEVNAEQETLIRIEKKYLPRSSQ